MATKQELEAAFRKADSAGNTADAQKLADAIRSMDGEESLGSKIMSSAKTAAGRTARSLLEAPAGIAESIVNMPGYAINSVVDASNALGFTNAERPVNENRALSGLINKTGLPEYSDDFTGRVANSMAQGAVGTAGVIGLGSKLSGSANAATAGVGRTLQAAPVQQLASEIPASLAGEGVGEFTDNPLAKMAAAIAGSMVVPAPKTPGSKTPNYSRVADAEVSLGIEGATTVAQKLGTPEEIAKQISISRSKELIDQAKKSNSKLTGALETFLNDLTGTGGSVDAGSAGRDAAVAFKKSLRQQQKEAAGPLYEKAAANEDYIETGGVEAEIRAVMDEYKPRVDPQTKTVVRHPVHGLAKEAMMQIRSAAGDIRDLQSAKEWIDLKLEKVGDSALGRREKRALQEIKASLVETMAEQSPDYARAKETFEAYQRPIDAANDSFIGILSNADNVQLASTVNKIFTGELPEILKLKNALQATNPRAYEAMFKAHLTSKINKISEDILSAGDTGVLPQNTPAVIYSKVLGGSPGGIKKLVAAAPSDVAKRALEGLNVVFRAASEGRGGKSLTKEISAAESAQIGLVKRMVGKLGGLAMVWGSNGVAMRDAIQPSKIVPDVGRAKRTQALIDSMFNRDFASKWDELNAIEPGTLRWLKAMDQYLGELDTYYEIESSEDEPDRTKTISPQGI